jgi:isopenicillin N synthase-like dioxygenase
MSEKLLEKIPSLDLADFLSGDPERKQKFVADLGEAYNTIGFIALRNHGLSDDLSNVYTQH